MKVSIITPCYNSKDKLLSTIQSVQSQTYKNYEHIIIDDCSPNFDFTFLEHLILDDSRIKLIKRTWNAGPAVTRNRGISEAKGKYIAFLDADDLWNEDKLEKQIEFMESENLSLSYSAYDVIDLDGQFMGLRTVPGSISYRDLLKSNKIGCLTAIYNKELLGKVYMPNIGKRQDLGLWLEILRNGNVAKGLNVPLAKYRVGGASLSSNKLGVLKYQWRLYREVENLGLFSSMYYFIHYAVNGVMRKH
ncbi:glycosyltransferase family 2 protein [Moritella sp. 24]|uniref:glycosyltransferase family 2 protein n=1 Tax=Moritella sp. 24 TaxID=2746230 RepID=UPI001BAE2C09|nr:glycosyltransferase family 2 protein [Moritella sp. 24]QUM77875.1 glycosyltransferase family 2 protein [Moritella sp. 24]